jgi:hypothetical protein
MELLALFVAFALLLFLAWVVAPRDVPWSHDLARVKPGAGRQAEWIAPAGVMRAVRRDYLAAHAWLNECGGDWGWLARELDRYAAGPYLKRQRAALDLLAATRGPRLAETLDAEHQVVVRHFTVDGLRCLLFDRETRRSLTTRGYWSGRAVARQALPDAVFVWQMVYDRGSDRWKIERLVQRLPAEPPAGVSLTLAAELPAPAGRDY